MGSENDKVHQNYKPPQGGVVQSHIGRSQIGHSQAGKAVAPNQNKQSNYNNSLNVHNEPPQDTRQQNFAKNKNNSTLNMKQPSLSITESKVIQEQNPTKNSSSIMKKSNQPAEIRQSSSLLKTEKNIKVSQSSIKLIEAPSIKCELVKTNQGVKEYEGEQYKGKKSKEFRIEAIIPEKDLIKQSNYFDESKGDIKIKPKLPTKFADFTVGSFEQINIFPLKTYLFDQALNDRLVA